MPSYSLGAHKSGATERGFEVLGTVRDVETIAVGGGVRVRQHLRRTYGRGRWRKMKGYATVRLNNGTVVEAEVHWFEAHGVGRRDLKIKRLLE